MAFPFGPQSIQAYAKSSNLTIGSDVLVVREKIPQIPGKKDDIEVDFSINRTDCEKLSQEAMKSSHKVQ